MIAGVETRGRMGRATLASVAIHVLAALSIPALLWTASGTPIETVSFSRIMHVVISTPRPRRPPPRAAAPHRSITPTLNFANHIRIAATTSAPRHTVRRKLETTAPAAPAVASVQQAGQGTSNSDNAPQATPSPAREVASVAGHQAGGYLPFGAEQPDPVLDPSVLKQLNALAVHVTLVVTVGDDGRTQTITFQPPVDAELENHIRSLLADASWDPAVCGGGVACEGHATIRL
ncbi:MAG: hypothetical protein WCB99_02605 [Candidatus Cybelea sp.]|jgi:hypothetical protein